MDKSEKTKTNTAMCYIERKIMVLWIKSSGSDYSQCMASNFITFCLIAGKIWQKYQAHVTETENREVHYAMVYLLMLIVP